jgi:hypothetical protein
MKNLRKIDFVLMGVGILFFIIGGFLFYSPGIKLGKFKITSPFRQEMATAQTTANCTGDYCVIYKVTKWLNIADNSATFTNPNYPGLSIGPAQWTVTITPSTPVGGNYIYTETWDLKSVMSPNSYNPDNHNSNGHLLTFESGQNQISGTMLYKSNIYGSYGGTGGGVGSIGSIGLYGFYAPGSDMSVGSATAKVIQPVEWDITGTIAPKPK